MFQWILTNSPLLYLTQSLWRDEVYSVLMAERSIPFFVKNLSFEPPFYYILLHFWIRIFGESEIAGRALSLVGFAGAVAIIVVWAETLFNKHWLRWWLPLFFFLNPMLLYYAMELRTYGWYMFFATLSLFAYARKKFTLWTVATILGFYTHTFFIIVPFSQAIHYFIFQKQRAAFRYFLAAGIAIAPWLIKIALEVGRLRQSWYFPVDLNLVTSVLGNLFVGYEGTPGYLWGFTKLLSLGIIAASLKAGKKAGALLTLLYIPLVVVIAISFIKPLYVNRYMIAVTIAQVLVIALAIYGIRPARVQKLVAGLAIAFVIAVNIWYPARHAKPDIRTAMRDVWTLASPTDVVIADNPLVFFETLYYSPDRTRVYLYNPDAAAFPWYVGDSVVSKKQMVRDYPPYPIRAFVVRQNGTFDLVYRTTL